jgi:hypothetical protein
VPPPKSHFAFATERRHANLSADDLLAIGPLNQLGVDVTPAVWDDAAVDWRQFDAVVVRSCWDYHTRVDEFLAWIDRIDGLGVPMVNPASVLRWNADKRYLRELERGGVRVVPTQWVERGDFVALADVLAGQQWHDAVVKPAVSASAHDTRRVQAGASAIAESDFRALVEKGVVLVQPFVDAITRDGEWSLVFLGGDYSHAVVKRPREGDFRVQYEHGGSYQRASPPNEIVEAAGRALALAPAPCAYARIDGCIVDGAWMLMELEILEPMLFLAAAEEAPGRFAAALVSALADTDRRP